MASGFLRVAVVGTTEVRIHWLTPIVWFVGGVALSRDGLGLAGVGAAACVYAVHVLGHWTVARLHRLPVSRVDMDAVGGSVATRGRAGRATHARVAFGGVMAHAVFGLVLTLLHGVGDFVGHLVWVNLVLGAINLLPLGRLDGAAGWRHVRRLLSEPIPMGDPSDPHPALRARALAAEADRDIGHSRVRRPAAPPPEPPEPDWTGDASTLADIADQVDALMEQARAEARARAAEPPTD